MDLIRKSVNITEESQKKIDFIRFEQRFKKYNNEAEILREALEIGLESMEKRGGKDD